MADSDSSHSHVPQAVARPSRASRGKKSLVHSSVISLRDLLTEFGQAFPNMLHLDAYNYPSRFGPDQVGTIARLFGISHPYRAEAPGPNDRACYPKPGAIRVYKETFYAGFRLPPHPFVFRLLAEARVCPTQLTPNSWRFIHCYMAQSRKHGFEPNVCVFRYLFKFVNASEDQGWVKIVHRSLARSCFISGTNPDSYPTWKSEWFYVFLDSEEGWDHFFRPNFSKSIDGSLRDLKLGIDEDAAIKAITADNLHHCALILSEGNLQGLGLSDLGPEGISFPFLFHFLHSLFVLFLTCSYLPAARAALDTIFKKREARAAKGSAVETHRDKRVRIGDGPSVTVQEAVPTFLSQRPPSLDEDTSPFTVTWGLQRRDTVVGSSEAAAVWSQSVITPRDRAEIVESSDDLQIERLGAQAVASVSLFLF